MKRNSIQKQLLSPDIVHSGPPVGPRIPMPGSVFSVVPPKAGASDALGRIALAYNVVTTYCDIRFEHEAYKNYHAADFDFNAALGFSTAFPAVSDGALRGDIRSLPLSDVVKGLLAGECPLCDGARYRIIADMYGSDPTIRELRLTLGLTETFFSHLDYTPQSRAFRSGARMKVVFHLRRQDIAGRGLLKGMTLEDLPPKLRRGLHFRTPLGIDTAFGILEDECGPGTEVDLIIASDGFATMRSRFGRCPRILQNIDAMEAEIRDSEPVTALQVASIRRLIGTDPSVTRQTMDAMYEADLVITASSSFPRLPCRFGRTPLISVIFPEESVHDPLLGRKR